MSIKDNVLSANNIKKYLNPQCSTLDIQVFDSVTSTNTLLKELAMKGACEGCVLAANFQTAGKGRLGRSFHSPSDTGIYFSILLRPDMPAKDSLFLTTSAAVAVSKSIEALSNLRADIKWVNDVYINEKKVCGILTEGAFNTETQKLDYAIVGIGINIFPPEDGFPNDIKATAGSVFSREAAANNVKNKLIAEILNLFMNYYHNLSDRLFFEEYRKRSFLIGRKIYIIDGSNFIPATAINIDEECHLIVQLDDGTIKELSSGEVSIKLNKPED